ncbi:MAG: hypothetical protein ABI137_00170 [Antricoccus sp.]
MIESNENDAASPACSGSAAEAQARIAKLQKGLLGGRGPGATSEELAPFMLDRVMLAATPTMLERELVAQRTELARGPQHVRLDHQIEQERDHLTTTVAQIVDRLAPGRVIAEIKQGTRRRVETLLDIPTVAASADGQDLIPQDSDEQRPFADPRWWRVFVIGIVVGASVVVGVAGWQRSR